MEFYFFHLMPYPHMPKDYVETYGTSWATIPNSLYDPKIVTFEDDENAYNQSDATGFIKINSLRLKASAKRKKED